MKFHIQSLIVCMILVSFIFTGCSLPARSSSGLEVIMEHPHTSTTIFETGPQILSAGVAALGGGVTRITFYANLRSIGEADPPDPSEDKFDTSLGWTPTAPGEYFLQVQVERAHDSAMSAPIRVCVLDNISLTDPGTGGTYLYLWGYGYDGPCTIPPAPEVVSGASTDVGIVASATPASIAYDNFNNCPHAVGPAIISFEADITDESNRVAFVTVRYYVEDIFSDSLILNQTASRPDGTRVFTGVTNDLTISLSTIGDIATIGWEARAIGRDGNSLGRDGPHTILAAPCAPAQVGIPQPIVIESTATDTPSADTSIAQACMWEAMLNVFLRKGPDVGIYDKLDAVEKGKTLPIVGQSEDGQFWAVQVSLDLIGYVTKSDKYSRTSGDCSKVPTLKDPEPPAIDVVPPKKPGGSGGAACSSYGTDSACNAAPGCSYDYVAKVCK